MKPGVARWSTNVNYAGGSGIGQPTKMPPSPGQEEDGIEPDAKVDPQIWNYKRWESDLKISQLEAIRAKNWQEASNQLASGTNPPIPKWGFYDPAQDLHTNISSTGAATNEVTSTNNGRFLDPVNVTGLPAMIHYDGFASGSLDVRVFVAGTDKIYYSSAVGAWTLWTGLGATGVVYVKGHHDEIGRFCFIENTNCDIYTTISTGTIPTVTDTAFAAVTPVAIKHSRHPSGFVYPGDSGNQLFMAVTSTEVNISSDGITWGTPSLHGVSNLGLTTSLGYSAFGSRWILPTKGVVGGLGTIAISDDNGATWVSYDKLPYRYITAPSGLNIACDGFGVWVVASVQSGTQRVELFYSVDNGDTWYSAEPAFDNLTATIDQVSLWYGGGQFNLAIKDNSSSDFRQFHSLTAQD